MPGNGRWRGVPERASDSVPEIRSFLRAVELDGGLQAATGVCGRCRGKYTVARQKQRVLGVGVEEGVSKHASPPQKLPRPQKMWPRDSLLIVRVPDSYFRCELVAGRLESSLTNRISIFFVTNLAAVFAALALLACKSTRSFGFLFLFF